MVSTLANDLNHAKTRLSHAERELQQQVVLEQQREGSVPRTECIVCLNAQVSTVLIPCGHLCVCVGCAALLQQSKRPDAISCPLCRMPVKQMHRVYLPVDDDPPPPPPPPPPPCKVAAVTADASTSVTASTGPDRATDPAAFVASDAAVQTTPRGTPRATPRTGRNAAAAATPTTPVNSTPSSSTQSAASGGSSVSVATPEAADASALTSPRPSAGSAGSTPTIPSLTSPDSRRRAARRVYDMVHTVHDDELVDDKIDTPVIRAIGSGAPRVLHARMQPSNNAAGALHRPSGHHHHMHHHHGPTVERSSDALRGDSVEEGNFDFVVPGAWEPSPLLAATWG